MMVIKKINDKIMNFKKIKYIITNDDNFKIKYIKTNIDNIFIRQPSTYIQIIAKSKIP